MYDNPVAVSGTGAAGSAAGLSILGMPAHWAALAAFVLVMAVVALFTILPRNREQVAKVLPAELR